MEKEILNNREIYLQRLEFYHRQGYDLEKEREFILDVSEPISGRILEVGTGKGHFALALAKRGYNFISIDISEQEQRIACLNIKYWNLEEKVDFRLEDAEKLSFLDDSFNVIFSINMLHHIVHPYKVLEEMIRVLSPKGKIILSDFTKQGLEIINRCHSLEGRRHDHFKSNLDEVKDYLSRENFQVKEQSSKTQRVLIVKR